MKTSIEGDRMIHPDFGNHKDAIVLHVKPKEPRFVALIEALAELIQLTLDYCRDVC